MKFIRRLLHGAILVLVTAVIVPIAVTAGGPFLVEWAKERGLYEHPSESVSTAMAFAQSIVTIWWFHWIAPGVLGFAAGAWLVTVLRSRGETAAAALVQQRRELIRQSRQLVEDARSKIWGDTEFRIALGRSVAFYALRQHLSEPYMQLFHDWRGASVTGAGGLTALMSSFLDELDRLEREWRLS
jgi:hypothetical protein